MNGRAAASATRALVEQLWEIEEARVGAEDRERLLALLIDHLAVAAGGSAVPSARIAREVLRSVSGGTGELPVIGAATALGVVDAAVANAVAAHSLDYDDIHSASSCHIGVVIFPAALAASVIAGASASSFITGVLRGYEAVGRIGRAARPDELYARGLHPTAVIGHFGAAVAAASVLGLDADRATTALGIVAPSASGTMQFLDDGDWTKRLNPGLAVRSGVTSALLARAGFMGGSDALLGPRGFLTRVGVERQALLDVDPRRPLEMRATSIKPHACCRYNQSPIDATLAVRSLGSVVADEIASIQVGLLTVANDIVWRPVDVKRRPQSVVDAQFSLPYAVAVALVDGAAGPEQYTQARLGDPRLHRIMDRVECVNDPALDAGYPELWAAWVRIVDSGDRAHEARIDHPRGDPEDPLTPEQLRSKFEALAQMYPSDRREAIWRACREMVGGAGRVSTLLDALRHA